MKTLIDYKLSAVFVFLLSGIVTGCAEKSNSISPKTMADALHTVLEADRTAYTRFVVNRLTLDEKVIEASEHWKDDKALLLPAQMFRAGAELAGNQNTFSYSLLSLWPINKKNAAKTDAEKMGLEQVAKTGENYYTEETLGDKHFFTAVYPDKAVAEACIQCHNKHVDSPKTDFKLGEVMGGVVIRIALDS
ncbi:MAG: Tll0287-like domain-containing protein [Gammaproteobacteria bacterium]